MRPCRSPGVARALIPAALAACLLAGCAVPKVDDSIAKTAAPTSASEDSNGQDSNGADSTSPVIDPKPRIETADGPLSVEASKALIANIGTGGTNNLQRHLAIEQAVAGTPLTADNAVTILRDGGEAFRAIGRAIRGARRSLNLEYYTIEDVTFGDDSGGPRATLSDLLIAKRKQGVAVNIIYDSYGSSDTPADFFARLKAAGVNLLDFHPIGPNPVNALTINARDHRKILVADGEIGIVGGVNLSKSYQSKSPGSDLNQSVSGSDVPPAADAAPAPAPAQTANSQTAQNPAANAPAADAPDANAAKPAAANAGGIGQALGLVAPPLPDQWRDIAARIEGPAVAQLQTAFRDHWKSEQGPPLDETGFFPKPTAKGKEVARIIASAPDQKISRYYVTLVSALRNAGTEAWISAAYFVPTPEEMEALTNAAKRGIDVRLLLPDLSDSKEAIEAAHSHYSELLESGVKIYETRNVVLHSKTVEIDDAWSAIGSSNFDHRSVLFNDEVDAVVLGSETADTLKQIFADNLKTAKPIDRATWKDERPATERVRGFFARLWEGLL